MLQSFLIDVLVVAVWNGVIARPFAIFASLASGFMLGWVGFFVALISGLFIEPTIWRRLGIDFETRQTWVEGVAIRLLIIVLALAGLAALIPWLFGH